MISKTEFIKEWIKDLLSGKYKQGTGQLCTKDKYCCLGVACLTGERLKINGAGFNNNSDQTPDSSIPGPWLRHLLGSSNPSINTDRGRMECTVANDCCNFSFQQIANYLELEKAFL